MQQGIRVAACMLRRNLGPLRDLAAVIRVIAFFLVSVLQRPFPGLWNSGR